MQNTTFRILAATGILVALLPVFLFPAGSVSSSPVTENEKGSVVRLPENAYQVQEPLLYQVQRGDDLHWLAAKFYGDARQWVKIYEANRSAIRNPNRLKVGQTLTIPAHVTAR
jgi:nucleoid-associated protein YgaU